MPSGLDGNPNPIVTAVRSQLIADVARQVAANRPAGRPMLVAVDGIDGAGKTTFADELAAAAREVGVRPVRATIDSFHRPRSERWQRGRGSPVGFYLDSHDLDALRTKLLEPFRSGPGMSFVRAVFDEPKDQPQCAAPETVGTDSVLVFDGLFLQRPELIEYWDLVVFLDGQTRVEDERRELVLADLPSSPTDIVDHALGWTRRFDRYAAGMSYYLDLVDPMGRADVVIDNNNLSAPVVVRS